MAREYPTPVLADAGYGVVTAFRDALTVRGLSYMVGITTQTTLWPPGLMPLPPRKWRGQGRPAMKLLRNTPRHRPIAVVKLAMALPARSWGTIRWREGTWGIMQSRFAALTVRAAHRDEQRNRPRAEEWLLIEWPKGVSTGITVHQNSIILLPVLSLPDKRLPAPPPQS